MVSQIDGRTQPGITDLEIKNISKNFGALNVLNAVSLDIYKGELCCLLGPSGCGKTTLLKIINGLLEPDNGEIILSGTDITPLSCQKRELGMVFQNYALFPHMNVYDNVAYGLRRKRVSGPEIQNRVNEALGLVRLPGYEKRRIHELSGGQQQRVALARALVIRPRALLLDEPLSNLDARLRADMRDEIKRIQSQLGITTVYVTHDQEEAMSIADRIVVMNNGNIEQMGTPFEVYENPFSAFVASFVGNINFIKGTVSGDTLTMMGNEYSLPGIKDHPEGAVTCAVRPERIRLSEAVDGTVKGTITSIAYFGSMVRYGVTVDHEQSADEIIVQVPVSSTLLDAGDSVTIDMDIADIRLFPE